MTARDLLELMRELEARGEAHALVTVVRAIAPTSAQVGARAIVLGDGSLHGWIGGGCAKDVVIGAALAAHRGRPAAPGAHHQRPPAGRSRRRAARDVVREQRHRGALHPAVRRTRLALRAGRDTRLPKRRASSPRAWACASRRTADEAPVVLVATQGQGDEAALEAALRGRAHTVLMIASRRKADALRDSMRARGIGERELAKLQAPAGPDAGAKAPAEVALVAIVGVLAALRQRPRIANAPAREAGPGSPQAGAGAQSSSMAPANGKFVNPVCGAPIDMATALHVESHAGESYYFCCDGCWKMFRQDPEKYAAIHRASLAKA